MNAAQALEEIDYLIDYAETMESDRCAIVSADKLTAWRDAFATQQTLARLVIGMAQERSI
jgi:hypothetical protein